MKIQPIFLYEHSRRECFETFILTLRDIYTTANMRVYHCTLYTLKFLTSGKDNYYEILIILYGGFSFINFMSIQKCVQRNFRR